MNRLAIRVGAAVVPLAALTAAQPPPWPPIPAQLNPPRDAIELTTDRIQSTHLEIRLARTEKATTVEEATGLIDAFLRDSGRRFYLQRIPVVTHDDVVQARVIEKPNTFDVELTFSPEGAARMQVATSAHYGKPLAIIINGDLVAAPVVQTTVSSRLIVSAGFTHAEAERIASGLQR